MIAFIYMLCVLESCIPQHVGGGGQQTVYRAEFSLITTGVTGTELRLSGLATSAFYQPSHLITTEALSPYSSGWPGTRYVGSQAPGFTCLCIPSAGVMGVHLQHLQ